MKQCEESAQDDRAEQESEWPEESDAAEKREEYKTSPKNRSVGLSCGEYEGKKTRVTPQGSRNRY